MLQISGDNYPQNEYRIFADWNYAVVWIWG